MLDNDELNQAANLNPLYITNFHMEIWSMFCKTKPVRKLFQFWSKLAESSET